jgi:hypothetical protein
MASEATVDWNKLFERAMAWINDWTAEQLTKPPQPKQFSLMCYGYEDGQPAGQTGS